VRTTGNLSAVPLEILDIAESMAEASKLQMCSVNYVMPSKTFREGEYRLLGNVHAGI